MAAIVAAAVRGAGRPPVLLALRSLLRPLSTSGRPATDLLLRPAATAGTARHRYTVLTAEQQRKSPLRVETAHDRPASASVDLTWSSGEVTQFPYVWLRDSCRCEQCFHPTALSRKLHIDELDINITPKSVQNDHNTQEVIITWPDDHVSRFPYMWLHERAFTPEQLEQRRKDSIGPKTVLWDSATIQKNLYKVDYDLLLGDVGVLRQTLHQLITYGLVVVTNSPTRFGVVEDISSRLGHTRLTHYGRTFRVSSKVNPNNLAYSSERLSPHLDQPYYEYVPGVQLLHCISQHVGSGGENTFADSFYVSELIRQRRPDLFQLLSTRPVEFTDVGVESESHADCHFHKVWEHTIIKLDQQGNVIQVCNNNAVRSYRLNVPFDLVKPMYEGLRMLHDLFVHPDVHLKYKMADGDVVVFNNRRITHGRLAFTVTEDSRRTLEGSYVDWDEILCRYRSVSEMIRRDAEAA